MDSPSFVICGSSSPLVDIEADGRVGYNPQVGVVETNDSWLVQISPTSDSSCPREYLQYRRDPLVDWPLVLWRESKPNHPVLII
jgi:hypothetical protein